MEIGIKSWAMAQAKVLRFAHVAGGAGIGIGAVRPSVHNGGQHVDHAHDYDDGDEKAGCLERQQRLVRKGIRQSATASRKQAKNAKETKLLAAITAMATLARVLTPNQWKRSPLPGRLVQRKVGSRHSQRMTMTMSGITNGLR